MFSYRRRREDGVSRERQGRHRCLRTLCYFLKFVTVLSLYKFVFTFLYKNKMHASETRRLRPPPLLRLRGSARAASTCWLVARVYETKRYKILHL